MKKVKATRKRSFTVDRRKWGRGRKLENGVLYDSLLYNQENNKMCCLGFVGRQSGISRKCLCSMATPQEVSTKAKFPKWLLDKDLGNSSDCDRAMEHNDSVEISNKMREYKLKRLFKKHGCTIKFTH